MRSVCVENNVEHKNNEHSRSPLLKKTQDWKIIGVFFCTKEDEAYWYNNFFPGSKEFCITIYFNL
jgi:hypothetical protein